MRILFINTSERLRGPAIAANRLMEALRNNGIQAKMLVRDKQTDRITVIGLNKSWWKIWQFLWERIVIWKTNHFQKHNLLDVDIANTGTNITTLPEFDQADVVHLHWVNQGMLSLKDIQKVISSGKPIIWTMHDMWPFTGICHYTGECNKYTEKCEECPLLYKGHKKDLSHQVFQQKEKILQGSNICFVACSQWMGKKAKQSHLLKNHPIVHIPNTINGNLFKPKDKAFARKALQFPLDKKLLLFGSIKTTDKRKGIDYLVKACQILAETQPEFCRELGIVIIGKQSELYKSLFPFPIYSMGYVNNDKDLVEIYNAVDLYVTPSLQDNLPNTIMEAMSCGVPCVGFNIGGIPEMIDHLHNGYVAEYKSANDFANGIYWALNEGEYQSLSEEARRKATLSYSESTIAKRYIEIYNKMIGSNE